MTFERTPAVLLAALFSTLVACSADTEPTEPAPVVETEQDVQPSRYTKPMKCSPGGTCTCPSGTSPFTCDYTDTIKVCICLSPTASSPAY